MPVTENISVVGYFCWVKDRQQIYPGENLKYVENCWMLINYCSFLSVVSLDIINGNCGHMENKPFCYFKNIHVLVEIRANDFELLSRIHEIWPCHIT